jgi:hypothetical protein
MQLRATIAASAGLTALALAAAYAPAAAADSKYFYVTIGGPGYAVNVGSHGVGIYAGGPVHGPVVAYGPVPLYAPGPGYVPAPIVYAPAYVAPPVVYRPYPAYRAYYRPPVVVRPYPAYRAQVPAPAVPHRRGEPYRYVAGSPY